MTYKQRATMVPPMPEKNDAEISGKKSLVLILSERKGEVHDVISLRPLVGRSIQMNDLMEIGAEQIAREKNIGTHKKIIRLRNDVKSRIVESLIQSQTRDSLVERVGGIAGLSDNGTLFINLILLEKLTKYVTGNSHE